jgi:hypothetical protein
MSDLACHVCGATDPPRNPSWRSNTDLICDPDWALIQERVSAASPPAADPLDVERMAEALHAVGVGCSSYICEPTTSTYIGLSKTMHETDAREVAAEYARLAREGEER